jgi:2-haloacid dehalogenase
MKEAKPIDTVKALTFDVFGTVVNWRAGISEEGRSLGRRKAIDADWVAFADAWRGRYQPSMSRVRNGEMPWTNLDKLHRASLDELLEEFGIITLDEREKDGLNRAWHRLPPWPDSVEGLGRLKKKFILATLSNGNVALLVNMARKAGLPWDAILGAEVVGHYKPQPQSYLMTAQLLDLAPHQCMMVAAHNDDLMAAGALGFRTAFVRRPTEYGPDQKADLEAEHAFDVISESFTDLANQLGC